MVFGHNWPNLEACLNFMWLVLQKSIKVFNFTHKLELLVSPRFGAPFRSTY